MTYLRRLTVFSAFCALLNACSPSHDGLSGSRSSQGIYGFRGDFTCDAAETACGQPSWDQWSCVRSCEKDLQTGELLAVRDEAGFYGVARWQSNVVSRVFYSFQHANENPTQKPLIVLFNGGPVVTTIGNQLSFNTGFSTLADGLSVPGPHANPDSWTKFANLLYIDAPGVGLSYDVPAPIQNKGAMTDAAATVDVLLTFLETHPQLRYQPIFLSGESYGGTRSAIMMQMLLHPDRVRNGTFGVADGSLADRIEAHFQETVGANAQPLDPAQDGRSFCGQILVQPALPDRDHQDAIEQQILGNVGSELWLSVPQAQIDDLWEQADENILNPAALSDLLGVDVSQISWMHADHRGNTGRGSDCEQDQSMMEEVFGDLYQGGAPLFDEDCYYLRKSYKHSFSLALQNLDDWLFLENLLHTETFMTRALEDRRIITLENVMPEILEDHPAVGSGSFSASDTEHARPGKIEVQIIPDATYNNLPSPVVRTIRNPAYQAGHMVAMGQPAQLSHDVEEWIGEISSGCGSDRCDLPTMPIATDVDLTRPKNVDAVDRICTVSSLSTDANTATIQLDCDDPGDGWEKITLQSDPMVSVPLAVGQAVRQRVRVAGGFSPSVAIALHEAQNGELILGWSSGKILASDPSWFSPLSLSVQDAGCGAIDVGGCFTARRQSILVVDSTSGKSTGIMSGRQSEIGGYLVRVPSAEDRQATGCPDANDFYQVLVVKKP